MRRALVSVCVGMAGVVGACGGSSGSDLLDGGGDSGNNADSQNGPDGQAQDVANGSDSSDGTANCPDFCATVNPTPAFCSDFDKEATPADWSATNVTNGGAVTIASAEEVSCPSGLSVSLPMISLGSTNTSQAKVVKNVAAIQSALHAVLKLEAFLPSNDTASYVIFFGVRSTADTKSGIFLTHHGDAFWFLTQNGFGMNVAIPTAPLTGAWNAMTLDVHFGGAQSGSVSFTYTGTDNATHTVNANGATANAAVASTTIEVGMEAPGTTEAAFSAYYDNVVLTVE